MVSVIVPVYNVEKYLCRCIDSIINQTYRDLDIILVDDGSLDKSGKICDDYARLDDRISVMHKQNGGVSSARNKGIELAHGDYIVFVDSDDYLKLNFIEKLMKYADIYNADVVCCNYQYGKYVNKDTDMIWIYSGIEACLKMFTEERTQAGISVSVFDKLFRRSILKAIFFSEKCSYAEDVLFATQVFCTANKVVKYDKTLYYYMQEGESAMRSEYSINRSSEINAYKIAIQTIPNCGEQLLGIMVGKWFNASLYHWEQCYIRRNNRNFEDKQKEIERELYSNIVIKKIITLGSRDKIRYTLFRLNKRLYLMMKRFLKKERNKK